MKFLEQTTRVLSNRESVNSPGDLRGWAGWRKQWAGILDNPNPVGPPGIPPVSPMASPPLGRVSVRQCGGGGCNWARVSAGRPGGETTAAPHGEDSLD